jgi:hypothetical protein
MASAPAHDGGMRRVARLCAAVLSAGLLSACGIGLSYGVGFGDSPPSVSLAASPLSAAPGDRIDLVAAASDDHAVSEVRFYRLDTSGDTMLGADASSPYALSTLVPTGASGAVRYVARAIDDIGQVAESQVVTVTVR